MTTLLDPQAAYELWADTYRASAHNPLMRAEEACVARVLRTVTASRALDVGTGSGRYVPLLAATGAAVIGLDRSLAMLRRGNGQRRICGDACALPCRRASFQLVNASLMVGDVANLRAWASEMARVLTRGGHLVYSDFHPTWVEQGWTRTFRDRSGALHAVRFEPHSIDEHLAALETAGLAIRAIREPRLTIAHRDLPVVVVFHAVKDAGLVP